MTQQDNPKNDATLNGLSLLQQVYDPGTFRQQGHALIDFLSHYLEPVQNQRYSTPVANENQEAN